MMFSEIVCREWNSIRVRFWSIGYKKRLALLVILLLVLVCFLVWSSLMVDLSDLKFADGKGDGVNDGSVWDKWVIANGLRAIGDIYDSCGEFSLFFLSGQNQISSINVARKRETRRFGSLHRLRIENRNSLIKDL